MPKVTASHLAIILMALAGSACGDSSPESSSATLPPVEPDNAAARTPSPALSDVTNTTDSKQEGTYRLIVEGEDKGRLDAFGGMTTPDVLPITSEWVVRSTDLAVIATVIEVSAAEANLPGRTNEIELDKPRTIPLSLLPTTWVTFHVDEVLGRRARPEAPKVATGDRLVLPIGGGKISVVGTPEALLAAGFSEDIVKASADFGYRLDFSMNARVALVPGDQVILPLRMDAFVLADIATPGVAELEPMLEIVYGTSGLLKLSADGRVSASADLVDAPSTVDAARVVLSGLDRMDRPSEDPGLPPS